MPPFARRLPRLAVLLAVLGFVSLASAPALERGPTLCLWRWLFHLSACPACGSTRALEAFVHGRWAEAWAFNHNVVVTAPALLLLLARDLHSAAARYLPRASSAARRLRQRAG
jgi:hypothetical protein